MYIVPALELSKLKLLLARFSQVPYRLKNSVLFR